MNKYLRGNKLTGENINSEIRIKVKDAIQLITEIFQAKSCSDYEAKTIAERLCGCLLYTSDAADD